MKNGGARPGAGRKKGSVPKKVIERRIKVEEMRNFYLKRIAEEFGPLVEAQINLAKGVFVLQEETVGKGKKKKVIKRVYQKPPDPSMVKYMFDQSLGKAPDTLNLSGEGGGPIKFVTFSAATEKYKKQREENKKRKEEVNQTHEHQSTDNSTDFSVE